jgi:hypothetical protein
MLIKIVLLFHPFYSKKRFMGLKAIVKAASVYIPELATEENYWQQIYLISPGQQNWRPETSTERQKDHLQDRHRYGSASYNSGGLVRRP